MFVTLNMWTKRGNHSFLLPHESWDIELSRFVGLAENTLTH